MDTNGIAQQQAAFDALLAMSGDLPAPPTRFDPAASYRVRLTRTVMAGDGTVVLRPSSDVVVLGSFAETIREAIAGAARVD
jgi:hypothetical protein